MVGHGRRHHGNLPQISFKAACLYKRCHNACNDDHHDLFVFFSIAPAEICNAGHHAVLMTAGAGHFPSTSSFSFAAIGSQKRQPNAAEGSSSRQQQAVTRSQGQQAGASSSQ